MMKKLTIGSGLLAAVLMAGCGDGTSLFPDFGTTEDMGTQDAAITLYKLQSGDYTVTSLTGVTDDGCYATTPTTASYADAFPLVNDGTGKVSFGLANQGTPPQPEYGMSCPPEGADWTNDACATVANPMPLSDNQGTLVRDNKVELKDNDGNVFCTFNLHREDQITLTADNTFTASYTEKRTDIGDGCTDVIKACTATWTWSFTKSN